MATEIVFNNVLYITLLVWIILSIVIQIKRNMSLDDIRESLDGIIGMMEGGSKWQKKTTKKK